jgi:hypothetical protein
MVSRDYGFGCRTEIFMANTGNLVGFIWAELAMRGEYAEVSGH